MQRKMVLRESLGNEDAWDEGEDGMRWKREKTQYAEGWQQWSCRMVFLKNFEFCSKPKNPGSESKKPINEEMIA